MTQNVKAPCPTCKALTEYNLENAYRPFCSERCQLIDLGEWFNEERRIPGEGAPDTTEQF